MPTAPWPAPPGCSTATSSNRRRPRRRYACSTMARPAITQGPPHNAGPIDGYYIVEADDVSSALSVAARIPAARLGGTVEVRGLRNAQ